MMQEPVNVQTMKSKLDSDAEIEKARKLDQEGNIEEALNLYAKGSAEYVRILDQFMHREDLREQEHSLVEELSGKLTSISNRVHELRNRIVINAFPTTTNNTNEKTNNNDNNTNNNTDKSKSPIFPDAPTHQVNTTNTGSLITDFLLVLNIEKVVCWKINPTDNARVIVGDGKYPLKIYQKENELKMNMYPNVSFIVDSNTPCLELTSKHYIFSINTDTENQMFAFVFDSNMPDIYTTLFENLLVPHCIFRRTERETQTIKLAHSDVTVEEPEDGMPLKTKLEVTTDEVVYENHNKEKALQVGENGEIIPFDDRKSLTITKENLDAVAEKVELSGKMITHGILQGGSYLQDGIQYYGNKIRDKVDVGYVEVPDVIKNSISYTKEVTPVVSALSGVVSSTAYGVAQKIGSYIGSTVYEVATSGSSGESDTDPNTFIGKIKGVIADPRTQSTIKIGQTSVAAVMNVFDALEEAGHGIIGATGQATATVVEKRFGAEMAEIVQDSVSITQDVLTTTANIRNLGPTALIKRNVRTAAKASAYSVLGHHDPTPLLENGNPDSTLLIENNEERDIGDDELELNAQMEIHDGEATLHEDSSDFDNQHRQGISPRK